MLLQTTNSFIMAFGVRVVITSITVRADKKLATKFRLVQEPNSMSTLHQQQWQYVILSSRLLCIYLFIYFKLDSQHSLFSPGIIINKIVLLFRCHCFLYHRKFLNQLVMLRIIVVLGPFFEFLEKDFSQERQRLEPKLPISSNDCKWNGDFKIAICGVIFIVLEWYVACNPFGHVL